MATTEPTNLTAFRRMERLFKDKRRTSKQVIHDIQHGYNNRQLSDDDSNDEDDSIRHYVKGNQSLIMNSGSQIHMKSAISKVNTSRTSSITENLNQSQTRTQLLSQSILTEKKHGIPGFLVLKSYLSLDLQTQLIYQALAQYTVGTTSNLHAHYEVPDDIWRLYVQDELNSFFAENHHNGNSIGYYNQDEIVVYRDALRVRRHFKQHEHQDEEEANEGKTMIPLANPQPLLKDISAEKAVFKWRWIALGLNYNWAKKEYFFEDQHKPIPPLLTRLCRQIIQETESITQYSAHRYIPQAGIVNFYSLKDNLMAHQDRSELNTEAPLISFSLGNSCVFLMGGLTTDNEPKSFLLESGDVALMYGPARRAFHGVPRILDHTIPFCLLAALSKRQDLSLIDQGAEDNNENNQCDNHGSNNNFDDAAIVEHKMNVFLNNSNNKNNNIKYEKEENKRVEPIYHQLSRQLVVEYMQNRRININIRMVYPYS